MYANILSKRFWLIPFFCSYEIEQLNRFCTHNLRSLSFSVNKIPHLLQIDLCKLRILKI